MEPLAGHYAFQTIQHNLADALAHRRHIQQTMERLEKEGMYDAYPTESWQDRGGNGVYMYHYFPTGRDGQYLGPDGKKKVYVGCDPARIAEARRLAANYSRYAELRRADRDLAIWLDYRESEIEALVARCAKFPQFDFRSLTL